MLHPLLSPDLLDDLEVFVITEDSDFILLLGSLVLVHGAVLRLLIKGLGDVLRQSHILQDNASELQALVLEHLVQKVQHLLRLILTLDLIHLQVGLATGYTMSD